MNKNAKSFNKSKVVLPLIVRSTDTVTVSIAMVSFITLAYTNLALAFTISSNSTRRLTLSTRLSKLFLLIRIRFLAATTKSLFVKKNSTSRTMNWTQLTLGSTLSGK